MALRRYWTALFSWLAAMVVVLWLMISRLYLLLPGRRGFHWFFLQELVRRDSHTRSLLQFLEAVGPPAPRSGRSVRRSPVLSGRNPPPLAPGPGCAPNGSLARRGDIPAPAPDTRATRPRSRPGAPGRTRAAPDRRQPRARPARTT